MAPDAYGALCRTRRGAQAYDLMRRIKALFDPQNLLNPGVLLNHDPQIHLKNLKPMPAVSPLLDRCIECGFASRNARHMA